MHDDDDLIVTYPRMAEFAIAEGFPVSISTLQKRGAPSVGTGPELVGYFGQRAATTKGLLRKWLRSELHEKPGRPRKSQLGAETRLESNP